MNIGKVMLDLQECLCEKIEEKEAAIPEYQGVCTCTVMWSNITMLDFCGPDIDCGAGKCGQAWVRFVGVQPDPSVDIRALRCTAAFLVTLEVGIGRCSSTPDQSAMKMELPDPDSYLSDVLAGVEDLEVIQQAVMCCSSRHRADQIRILNMEPFGPEGGCFGTAAMLSMQVIV